MSVQGADRLVKVRRCWRKRHAELVNARDVVEVTADDLGRLDRRKMYGVGDCHGATVGRH